MRPSLLVSLAAATALIAVPLGIAATGTAGAAVANPDVTTLAVYGDSPYGITNADTSQTDRTAAFISTINADPDVSLVLHVGDIHSGKQNCTVAYDTTVRDLWTGYVDPLVYTPGDNEWTDCNKAGEGGGAYNATTGQIDYKTNPDGSFVDYAHGDPIANLALVRSLFFPVAGRTLGANSIPVISQAKAYDRRFPTDGQFVENVMWENNDVVFVTINVPGGSNNDSDVWYGAPAAQITPEQVAERENRTGATTRWLEAAFRLAAREHAKGVVIGAQADMWDPEKGAAHQVGYAPIVASLASLTASFGKPVLMINGDSHVYRSDNPLSQTAGCTWETTTAPCTSVAGVQAGNYEVPNFHRLVVHGSTFPLEWLKLTINSDVRGIASTDTSFGLFSWARQTQAQLNP
jgi:hypothetical protein